MFYLAQRATTLDEQMSLVVRTAGDPRSMLGSDRAAVRAAAPSAPLEGVMTMEDKAAATLSRPRLYAVLLTTFAAFALAIAGVGLFGVLSYTVAQRAREIGVRSALGAQVSDIVGLVLRQSMTIAAAGVVVGPGVAVAHSRVPELPLRRHIVRSRQLCRRRAAAHRRRSARQRGAGAARGARRSGEGASRVRGSAGR